MKLAVVAMGEGCSEEEIAAKKRRTQRPLPAEVRQFYGAMKPNPIFFSENKSDFGFYEIGSGQVSWISMKEAEPAEDWKDAFGLALGQSVFGDPFWWIEGHRTLPNGSIFLFDHEGALGGDISFVHYARNYCEFLAKVAYFKTTCPEGRNPLFDAEYLELNPTAKIL